MGGQVRETEAEMTERSIPLFLTHPTLHDTLAALTLFSPTTCISGAVAQLGARVNGIHEVAGSIPASSTIYPQQCVYLSQYVILNEVKGRMNDSSPSAQNDKCLTQKDGCPGQNDGCLTQKDGCPAPFGSHRNFFPIFSIVL